MIYEIREREKHDLEEYNFDNFGDFNNYFNGIFDKAKQFNNKRLYGLDLNKFNIDLKIFSTLELMIQLNGTYESYKLQNPNKFPITGFCTVKSFDDSGKTLLYIDSPYEGNLNKNFRGKNLYDFLSQNDKSKLIHSFYSLVSILFSILNNECKVGISTLVSSIRKMTIYAEEKKLYGFIDKLYQEVGVEQSFTKTNEEMIEYLTNEDLVIEQFDLKKIIFGRGIFRLIVLHYYFNEYVLFENKKIIVSSEACQEVNATCASSEEPSKEVRDSVTESQKLLTWCQKASPKKETLTIETLEPDSSLVKKDESESKVSKEVSKKLIPIKESLIYLLENFFKNNNIEDQLSEKLSSSLMVIVNEIIDDMTYFLIKNISFNIIRLLENFHESDDFTELDMRVSNQINCIDIPYMLINNIDANIKLIGINDIMINTLIRNKFEENFQKLSSEIIDICK